MSLEPNVLMFEAWPKQPEGMIFGVPKGVRVTHLPTGLFACVDHHRHQFKNKQEALRELEHLLSEKGLL